MPVGETDELEVAVCTTVGNTGPKKVCHRIVGYDDGEPVVACNTPGRYRDVDPEVYPQRRPCTDGCWDDDAPDVLYGQTVAGEDS